MFLSLNIRDLRITPQPGENANHRLITTGYLLCEKLTRLRSFCLAPGPEEDGPDINHRALQFSVMPLLNCCHTLVEIILPLYYINPPVIVLLSHLPALEILDMTTKPLAMEFTNDDGWTGPTSMVDQFHGYFANNRSALPLNSFPVLKSLGLAVCDPDGAISLLTQQNFPIRRLRNYAFRFSGPPYNQTASTVSTIIDILISAQSPVTGLQFIMGCIKGFSLDEIDVRDIVTYEHISRIRLLSHLVRFQISAVFPVRVNDGEFSRLVNGWSSLDTLLLNPNPIVHTDAHLSLHSLLVAAQHCPNLKRFGAFITTMDDPVPSPSLDLTLPHLCQLHMGSSLIKLRDPARSTLIASFLASLIPHRFDLAYRDEDIRLDTTTVCVTHTPPTTLSIDKLDRLWFLDEEWKFVRNIVDVTRERDHFRDRVSQLEQGLTALSDTQAHNVADLETIKDSLTSLRQVLAHALPIT